MVSFNAGINRFQSYLTAQGLDSSDIPKAFVLHEMLGITMLAITWTFCYCFPLKNIAFFETQFKKLPPVQSYSKSKTMAVILDALSSRRGVAYLESSCLRKIIRPFTIPGKMWLVFTVLKHFKLNKEELPDTAGASEVRLPKASPVQSIAQFDIRLAQFAPSSKLNLF